MILLGKVFEKHPVQFSHRYQPSEVLGPGGPRLRARFVIHKPWHLFVCLFCFLFVASDDKAMTLPGGKKSQYWLRDRMPIFPFSFTSQQYSKETTIYQVTISIYKSSPSLPCLLDNCLWGILLPGLTCQTLQSRTTTGGAAKLDK